MEKILRTASRATPDPERAFKNLSTFCDSNPGHIEKLKANITQVSMLFSHSQFLANFSISNPDILFHICEDMNNPPVKEALSASLKGELTNSTEHRRDAASGDSMKSVRQFKKKELLRITLRDILKKADITDIMLELSTLADVIISESVTILRKTLNETYGEPEGDAFSVISLGKLGSEELNYSSDVDLILVYAREGETSGVKTPHGITANRITNHEYYCKLGENLNRFLSINTEDGFAYRVDLRLRPEGQRGSIALPLAGYETYYESWGRAWERAMLLRARPVAGDTGLGDEFLDMIRPFVYRKYLDFGAINEIRQIKTRIDSTFKKNDIKRGYGGIREIEFFIHALQLIYAGKEPMLRERVTQKALHRLFQKNIIGQGDYSILLENYRYLRTLEHRLQQVNDLQTHSLPADEAELDALGKKMGFQDRQSFTKDLELRRNRVRTIYDSLFKEEKKEAPEGRGLSGESRILFDEELSDPELREFLGKTVLKDVSRGVRNIQRIRDSIYHFQTLRGRRLLGEILPLFADAAIESANPDMALNHLESFAALLSTNESYLDIFRENKDLIPVLIGLFSQSEYLSKTIIRRPDYLELIGQELLFRKSLAKLKSELSSGIKGGQSITDAIRLLRQIEELRLSLLFLQKKISAVELIKGLSRTAEAVLSAAMENLGGDLAIIGLGKLGGREITFNSDLDIIFATEREVTENDTRTAERLLRLLISYTRDGIAYKVDTRLRPDGTKGVLVSTVSSLKDYYSRNAAFWEFQALLKARPVGGDIKAGSRFMAMSRDILKEYGHSISPNDIRAMRERIQKELSKESEGRDRLATSYDIKLGTGGLEELEFTVQFLQLKNCGRHPSVIVQSTLDAIRRLKGAGALKKQDADFMTEAYIFFRTLESYLRLREKDILKKNEPEILNAASEFLGFKDKDEFIRHIDTVRTRAREIYNSLVV